MGFRQKIQYFLVHTAGMTNQEAARALKEGRVEMDGRAVVSNCILPARATVKVDGQIRKSPLLLRYLAFNKPRGFISSMNSDEKGNISTFIAEHDLRIAGRLDKDSEGLLLLSNDGNWIEKICNPLSEKEKEYHVVLRDAVSQTMLENFRKGVLLRDGTLTRPAGCELLSDNSFRIILTEGKYRQIRRMCHVSGATILELKRVSIAGIQLNDLLPGQFRELIYSEIRKINGF